MAKKWYSYFVVTDESGATAEGAAADRSDSAPPPRRVSEIAPDLATEPPPMSPAAPVDLSVVYDSAKITAPSHGYTVLKVAEMLQSEHIRTLPSDVKRKSIMVALDAAGVKVDDIVEDAVRRDRALDAYERVLQKHVADLDARMAVENRQLEDEIARRAAELRARIDENRRQVAAEQAELLAWRSRKHQEEAAIAETVGHFVSENPVTLTAGGTPDKGDTDVR